MEPLDREELEVIHFIETYWNAEDEFPSLKDLMKQFPDLDLEESFDKDTFIKALDLRGVIVPPDFDKYRSGQLTKPKMTKAQMAAVVLITDFRDRRSQGSKLKSIGVTTVQWNGWLRNAHFKKYLHDLSSKHFHDSLEVAHSGLLKKVEEGDTNAVKFYLELTGRYGGENTTVENLRLVISRLVESIQKHVREPEVIAAIEADFKLIADGKQPDSSPVGKMNVMVRNIEGAI